jgi:hypothetical protein
MRGIMVRLNIRRLLSQSVLNAVGKLYQGFRSPSPWGVPAGLRAPRAARAEALEPRQLLSAVGGGVALPAPSGLTATPGATGGIELAWAALSGENSFRILRANAGTGAFSPLPSPSIDAPSFTDIWAAPLTAYDYEVVALDSSGGASSASNMATATAPLNAPANILAAPASAGQINLTWDHSANPSSFTDILRSTDGSSFTELTLLQPGVTSYSDIGLSEGTDYFYTVRAVESGSLSAAAPAANAWTAPAAPTLRTAVVNVANGKNEVDLTWGNNSRGADQFDVQRSEDGGTTWSNVAAVSATTAAFADSSVLPGHAYSYRVVAASPVSSDDPWAAPGLSAASNAITLNTPGAGLSALAASTVSASKIKLSWSPTGAAGFNVYLSVDGSHFVLLTNTPLKGTQRAYVARDLAANAHYYFEVQGIGSPGTGGYAVADGYSLPNAPSSLSLTRISNSEIDLSWNGDGDSTTTYYVYRAIAGTGKYSLVISTTAWQYADKGVSGATRYSYKILADGATRLFSSGPSNVATSTSVSPSSASGAAPATANFPPPPNAWYVDNLHGSNTNNGTSPTTAFQTIAFATSAAKTYAAAHPGVAQTVEIETGTGVYRESVTPMCDNLSFIAYNSEPVTITGMDLVDSTPGASWSVASTTLGYIHTIKLPTSYWIGSTGATGGIATDQVFEAQQPLTEDRFPYSSSVGAAVSTPTLLTIPATGLVPNTNTNTAFSFNTTALPNPSLWNGVSGLLHFLPGSVNGSPNYYGEWVAETCPVQFTYLGSSTVKISGSYNSNSAFVGKDSATFDNAYRITAGDKYYLTAIQGSASTAFGMTGTDPTHGSMWTVDSSPAQYSLHVWDNTSTPAPASDTVEVKTRDVAFDLSGRKNMTVSGITLVAATVYTDSASTGDTIRGITAKYISQYDRTGGTDPVPGDTGSVINGWNGEYHSGIQLLGQNDQLIDSEIEYCAGNAVITGNSGDEVVGNYIHDVDTMGTDNGAVFTLPSTSGPTGTPTAGAKIDYNTMKNSGRSLIVLRNITHSEIRANDLSAADMQCDDGGAIYAHDDINTVGNEVTIGNNRVHDIPNKVSVGIYLDNSAAGFIVFNNVVYAVANATIQNPPEPGPAMDPMYWAHKIEAARAQPMNAFTNQYLSNSFAGTPNSYIRQTNFSWDTCPTTPWLSNILFNSYTFTSNNPKYDPTTSPTPNPSVDVWYQLNGSAFGSWGAQPYDVPIIPAGVNLSEVIGSSGVPTLQWTAVALPSGASVTYQVYGENTPSVYGTGSPAGTLLFTTAAGASSAYLPGTYLYYYVQAVANGQTSTLPSNEVYYPKGPQVPHVAVVQPPPPTNPTGPLNWAVDSNGSHNFDLGDQTMQNIGAGGDVPVSGDWFGDGVVRPGYFHPDPVTNTGTWYLQNPDGSTYTTFVYGSSTDVPIVGDWLGIGTTRVGFYRGSQNQFWLDTLGDHGHAVVYNFGGGATFKPIIGDWNGDGRSKIGLYANGTFYLDVNGNGVYDTPDTGPNGTFVFRSGLSGDVPVAGDWNLDGITDVGYYRGGYFTLDSNGSHQSDAGVDLYFFFGGTDFLPLVF